MNSHPNHISLLYDHDQNPLTPGKVLVRPAWDLNASAPNSDDITGDGDIDGRVAPLRDAQHDGPFAPAVIDSGYTGFAAMTNFPRGRNVNPRGQIIDAWKTPLRIARLNDGGNQNFELKSAGPDHVFGTSDDIVRR